VLFQAIHDIIGNAVAFFFGQFIAKSAHKFARASQRRSDGETQHVPTSAHSAMPSLKCGTMREVVIVTLAMVAAFLVRFLP
jgi:hypothetical protein